MRRPRWFIMKRVCKKERSLVAVVVIVEFFAKRDTNTRTQICLFHTTCRGPRGTLTQVRFFSKKKIPKKQKKQKQKESKKKVF